MLLRAQVVARLGAVALIAGLVVVPASPAQAAEWEPRPEDHPETTMQADIPITVSDGTVLLGDLLRPVDAEGNVVETPLPVVVTITAYNKTVIANPLGRTLAGADPAYLVKRGYVQLTVDARGTGTSGGTWEVFSAREQLDAKEVVEWAAQQPWSNGSVAMTGASYMGITQLFAAGQNPEGLKAIFPQVPSAEVYRDVAATGGALDVGFMPMWLGIVYVTGLIPPSSGTVPPQDVLTTLLTHIVGGADSLDLMLNALQGGERAYDGEWYEERSTLLRSAPNIDVPTFLVGGHYDLFQRGTPMIFQALHERDVPVKMILGPWDHLKGSSGAEVADAGYGDLSELQLRWFDHHVKGLPDPALDDDIADFTYLELGSDEWKQRDAYLDEQQPQVYKLSGTSALGSPALLTEGDVTDGQSQILPLPLAGLCSRSATQWTAGILGMLPIELPCDQDNSLNDLLGVVYETAPMDRDLQILGPVGARLYASSTTGDGLLSVHVSLVGPDGVERLTGGWQTISLNATDESRSLMLGDEIIQPWHPYTVESRRVLDPGEIAPIDVEVFPTGAVIPAGHRLRMSVQSFDLPHLLPNLETLPGSAGVITIHNDAEHPSRIVLPALSAAATDDGGDDGSSGGSGDDGSGAGGSGDVDTRTIAERLADRTVDAILPGTGAPPYAWAWLLAGAGLIAAGGVLVRRRVAPTATDLVRERLSR